MKYCRLHISGKLLSVLSRSKEAAEAIIEPIILKKQAPTHTVLLVFILAFQHGPPNLLKWYEISEVSPDGNIMACQLLRRRVFVFVRTMNIVSVLPWVEMVSSEFIGNSCNYCQ